MSRLDWEEMEESEIKEQLANVLRDKNMVEISKLSGDLRKNVLNAIRNLNEDESYLLHAFKFTYSVNTWKAISELDFGFDDEELLISMIENIDLSYINEEWLQKVIKYNEKAHYILLNRSKDPYFIYAYSFLLEINSKPAIETIHTNYPHISFRLLNIKTLEEIFKHENAEEIIDRAIQNDRFNRSSEYITLEAIDFCLNKISTPYLYNFKLNKFPKELTDEDIEKLVEYGNPDIISYTSNDEQRVKLLESILNRNFQYQEEYLIELASIGGEKVTDLLYDSEYPNVRLEVAKKQNPKYSSFFLNDKNEKIKAEAAKGQINTLIKLIRSHNNKNLMLEIAELLIPETFDALIEKNIYKINEKIAHKCNNEQLQKIGIPSCIGAYAKGDLIYNFIDKNKRNLTLLSSNQSLEKDHLRYIMSLGYSETNIGSDLTILIALELAGEGGIEYALKKTREEGANIEDEILRIKEMYEKLK